MDGREPLVVIRSKPVRKKKLDVMLDLAKLFNLSENLDGITIFSPTQQRNQNSAPTNDPPATEL